MLGYGTEIGAFIRLDDLQPGYAFDQVDRAIIMSPQKVNARVVLPVTTLEDVLQGYPVDYILYANNYEQVDEDHPLWSGRRRRALAVFREGRDGQGHYHHHRIGANYFANIFGPAQYRRARALAEPTFRGAFRRRRVRRTASHTARAAGLRRRGTAGRRRRAARTDSPDNERRGTQVKALDETNETDLQLVSRGKVRDVYALRRTLLIVATDRISAFE